MADSGSPNAPVSVKQLTLPLRLSLAYVIATVIMYFFGAYVGGDPNKFAVGGFMLAVLAMFTVGYAVGIRRTAGDFVAHPSGARARMSRTAANRLVAIGALWFLCYSLASLQRAGVTDPLSLARAVADPRASYYAKFAHLNSQNGSAIYRALNLMGVFYFLAVPYMVLYWRDLRRWVRGLSVVALAAYLLYFLSIGTQKGVADLLIMFFACALPLYALRRGETVRSRFTGRRAWVLIGAVALVGLVIITTSLGLRTDDTSSVLKPPEARELYERLSPVLGSVLGRGFVILSSYVSQGYHGLALALRLPFVPAGVLAPFKALSSYLPQYLGHRDPYELSYPVRVGDAFGWSATGNWSSVYPWYASAVSFPGVILLAAVFGFFLARVWRRLMLSFDGVTLSVFVTCVVAILYSPANNQLFNERLSGLGVVTLLCLYTVRNAVTHRARARMAGMLTGSESAGGVAASCPVAVFAPAFPPAYRGGGPIRSLETMVSRTPAGFKALVLTSDKDLGESGRLPVESNRWIPGKDHATYYASLESPRYLLSSMFRLRTMGPRILYFNSFFNRPLTVVPLLLWRLGFWGSPTVLLAPRGEFGSGALTRHTSRKSIWIRLVRLLRIDRSVLWHATSEQEREDIQQMWGGSALVILRENETLLADSALEPRGTSGPELRLVFLGRLTELKGAAIVLEALRTCKASVSFDVYGPHEDAGYFEHCRTLARSMPPCVTVRFHDGVEHARVQETMNRYEAFVYPTAGENFGHVLAEALSSSCIVVTTPTTPWTSLLLEGAGIVVADREAESWRCAIESLAAMSPDERLKLRRRAGEKYGQWAKRPRERHLWELALERQVPSD